MFPLQQTWIIRVVDIEGAGVVVEASVAGALLVVELHPSSKTHVCGV